jgi:hypothetical protein
LNKKANDVGGEHYEEREECTKYVMRVCEISKQDLNELNDVRSEQG